MLPPYLTDTEIADLCDPLTQGAAQIRLLRSLGVRVERKANGRPLVWRRDVEQPGRSSARDTVRPSNEPNWGRA